MVRSVVTLKAELNPNGQFSNYTIKFGEDSNYAGGAAAGTLSVSNTFESVSGTFTGLQPNTTYHYQLEASNAYGETKTADQTFTTERSAAEERAAEDCPNGPPGSTLREENHSTSLPDCRAYEKMTPNEKDGGEAFQAMSFAPGGERVLYFSEGAFANAVQNELAIPYLAHRSGSGWSTQAVISKRLGPPSLQPVLMENYGPELDRWLFAEMPGFNNEEGRVGQKSGFLSMGFANGLGLPEDSYNFHASPTITLEEGTPRTFYYFMNVYAESTDLSRLFILTASRDLPFAEDPRPEHGNGFSSNYTRIYEVAGADGPSPTMRLVSEVPLGLTNGGGVGGGCQMDVEDGQGRNPARNVSADGATIVYWDPIENAAGANCGEGTPNPFALFARTGEAAPVQLNVPLSSECTSGHPCATALPTTPLFDGISEDGRRVWFTTTQPLVNSDTDNTNDLYMAKLDEGGQLVELVQASAGETNTDHTAGEGADLGEEGVETEGGSQNQGVIRVSADGSHVAFESPAVLTMEENSLSQRAVAGANNVYVYDTLSGDTKFVTELCSAPGLSGSNKPPKPEGNHQVTKALAVADQACPANLEGFIGTFASGAENDDNLWLGGRGGESAFTPNGKDLLFSSYGRLEPGDTDNVKDVYRYDFPSGQLKRVSFGRNGNDGNGNDDTFPALFAQGGTLGGNVLAEDESRSMAADGAVVIFNTAAPLVSHDTNEGAEPACEHGESRGCDVYEWEEDGYGTCTEAGGCISLISDGVEPHGPGSAVISASGRDIAFGTSSSLVPEDTDGIGDIYDARVDGGFHAYHPPSKCLSPEACRPPATSPPTSPNFTTESNVSGGNGAPHLQCAKGKRRVTRHGQVRCVAKHRHRQSHHKGKHHRKSNHNRAQARAFAATGNSGSGK